MNDQMVYPRKRNTAAFALSQVFRNIEIFAEDAPRLGISDLLQRQSALWESHDYDSGLLLRGQTLLAAEKWAAKHADLLSETERDFLCECRQSQRLAERERGRSQWLRWALAGLTLLGMALVCLLNQAWTRDKEQTKIMEAASSRAAQAEAARSRAESRALAAYAGGALEQDARLAILLALESVRAAQNQDGDIPAEASRVLADALRKTRLRMTLNAEPDGKRLAAAWSPDSTRIAATNRDGTVNIWNAASGELALGFGEDFWTTHEAIWSHDGARLLTITWLGVAFILDARSGERLLRLNGHESGIQCAAWSDDNARALTADHQGVAIIWDAESGAPLLRLAGHRAAINYAAWSADGVRVLTVSSDGTAMIWDAANGDKLRELRGHNKGIASGCWSADGLRVVTAGWDGKAIIWDAASGSRLLTLAGSKEPLRSAAWRADGTRILGDSEDGRAYVWDADSGALSFTLGGTIPVEQAAWSPNGRLLAAVLQDGSAAVWDAASGVKLFTLGGPGSAITGAQWSADGEWLLTIGGDGALLIWDAGVGSATPATRRDESRGIQFVSDSTAEERLAFRTREELDRFACRRAGRNLTPAEWAQYIGAETPYRRTCAELP
jgi:WD40 repeat protein